VTKNSEYCPFYPSIVLDAPLELMMHESKPAGMRGYKGYKIMNNNDILIYIARTIVKFGEPLCKVNWASCGS
jgi:hypothetical protein